MKNILNIMHHDLRKITGSVVALITIMGLCIVPCLYAWFNIFSNWAPYESDATGRIAVAVANLDEGASALGLEVNVGDKIVEALEANDAIGWQFADDEKSAIQGVYSGKYYAAIVIPEGFSDDVLSFTRGDLTNPKIKYYENEKKNAIAPKITGKAKTALQEEVNAAFVKTLAGYVTDAASVAEANGIDPASTMADLSERIEALSRDITSCVRLADSAAGLTDAAGSLLDVSCTFIGSTQKVLSDNDKLLKDAEDELKKVKKPDTSGIDKAAEKAKGIGETMETLDPVLVELLSASDTAFKVFLDKNRDDWVRKVDKDKKRADEQAKFVKDEGFTALASKFTELSKTLEDISAGLRSLNKDMSYDERKAALEKIIENKDKAEDLTEEINKRIRTDFDANISKALANTKTSLSAFRSLMSDADKDLGSLSKNMSSYDGSIGKLRSSIDTTAANLKELQNGAGSVAALLSDAAGNDLLRELSNIMGNDEAAVAEYLANPIQMKTEVIWPIETYGSAMAPFYTVLAQWVGALLTAVLIKVKVRKRDDLTGLRLFTVLALDQ